jgi:hypothetical protein
MAIIYSRILTEGSLVGIVERCGNMSKHSVEISTGFLILTDDSRTF